MRRLCLIVVFLLAGRDAAAQLAPLQSPSDFRELEPGERYQWGRSTCVVEPSPVTLVCDGPAGLKTLALPGVTTSAGRVSMNTEGSESVFSPSAVQSGDDVLLQYAAYDDATSTGYTVLLRMSLPNLPVLWASALPGGSTETLVEPHEAYVSTDIRQGGQVVSDAIYAVSLADGTVTTSVQGAVGHLKGLAQQRRWAGEIIGTGGARRASDAITYAATVFGPRDAPHPAVQLFHPTRYRVGTFPASVSSAFGRVAEPDGRMDLSRGSGSESIRLGSSACTVRVLLGTLSCSGAVGTWSLNLVNEVRLPGELGYAEVGPTFSDYGFADRALSGQTYEPYPLVAIAAPAAARPPEVHRVDRT